MSGGDGKDHNSGAYDSGGSINGTSGKGGPSSGGASDHSGWSSENNFWGGGGNGANHSNENTPSNYEKDVSRQVGDTMARPERKVSTRKYLLGTLSIQMDINIWWLDTII